MEKEKITEGLICVLGCVESCGSFRSRKDPKNKQMELVSEPAKVCMSIFITWIRN